MTESHQKNMRAAISALNKNSQSLRSLDRLGTSLLTSAHIEGRLRYLEGKDLRQSVMVSLLAGRYDGRFDESLTVEEITNKLFFFCYNAIRRYGYQKLRLKYKPPDDIPPEINFKPPKDNPDSDKNRLLKFVKTDPDFKNDKEIFYLLKFVFSGFTLKEACTKLKIPDTRRYYKMNKLKIAAKKYFKRNNK